MRRAAETTQTTGARALGNSLAISPPGLKGRFHSERTLKTVIFLCLLALSTFPPRLEAQSQSAVRPTPDNYIKLSVSKQAKRKDSILTCFLHSFDGKMILSVCISRTGSDLPGIKYTGLTVMAFRPDEKRIEIVQRNNEEVLIEVGDRYRGTTAQATYNIEDKTVSLPITVEVVKDGIKDVFVMEPTK